MNVQTSREDDDAVANLEPDPAAVEAAEQADVQASDEVMNLLAQHVPLALLADLASPAGPESPTILEDEGLPDVEWWDDAETAGKADQGSGADRSDA